VRVFLPTFGAWIALTLLVGCATTSPDEPAPAPPAPTYEEEITRASQAVAEKNKVLRYNPVKCNCPPFEVHLGPRWVRVVLENLASPDSVAAGLLKTAQRDLKKDQLIHYDVIGDLSTSPEYCGQGALFLTLSVDALAAKKPELEPRPGVDP
jgi:hypothetical protein